MRPAQVLALTISPTLLDHPRVGDVFPADAIARAKQILQYFPGGLGAYSDSRGSEGVRKEIAEYLSQRDGYPSDPNVRPSCSFACQVLMDPLAKPGNCRCAWESWHVMPECSTAPCTPCALPGWHMGSQLRLYSSRTWHAPLWANTASQER